MTANSTSYTPPYKVDDQDIVVELNPHLGVETFTVQPTRTGMPMLWVPRERLIEVLTFLRQVPKSYVMLYDLHGVDERLRTHRRGLPSADSSIFYRLTSLERNGDVMIKIALSERDLNLLTVTRIWPNANWYKREVWDTYSITFTGHPHLTRILILPAWQGHPLRKDYLARATEFDPYSLSVAKQDLEQEVLRFESEDWGMKRHGENEDYMFLSLGPNHPFAHGAFHIILRPGGKEIIDCVPEIGYHRRSAEKMAERQSWHSFIPYTDRIDYLGGVMNNLPYVPSAEKLTGIKVPQRVDVIRIMMAEFFRILNHLLYLSTRIQDVGAMTPVFSIFTDRRCAYKAVEVITGFCLHPAWYRIGGVAHDLPCGWDKLVRELLNWMPKHLNKYETAALKNSILRGRIIGVAQCNAKGTLEWGTTGAGLRAIGCDFDLRKTRPHSGCENFESEVPLTHNGDAYDRRMVKMDEMRQGLRIIEQCLKNTPEDPYKADHPLTTLSPKERALQHIKILITHFLQVFWGPVMPANKVSQMIEATKGINNYYLTSDGSTMGYHIRIRTPSFAYLQQIPSVINGSTIADLIVYLGSTDFVMADVDR